MRTVAVLLLVASLFVTAAQAAPVLSRSMTLPSSDVTARANGGNRNLDLISPERQHDGSHSDCELNDHCILATPHQHASIPVGSGKGKSVSLESRSFLRHLGHTISHATHAISHTVKSATHLVQHTGGKILKVGLKIAATGGEAASKVAKFIPGLGPVAGVALEKGGEELNTASNAIHEHIGGNLGKAMHTMDEAQKIIHYIPRDVFPVADDFLFE